MKKQNIETKNTKGRYHGYQEMYLFGNLWYRVVSKNSKYIGYYENHHGKQTTFYIR